MYNDANNWYGCALSESLLYDEVKFNKNLINWIKRYQEYSRWFGYRFFPWNWFKISW